MNKILVVFFISLLSSYSRADLTCSANGLNVLYINGVNVEEDGNKASSEAINRILIPISPQIDKSGKYNGTEGIWNVSRNLLNDVEELKAQLAANHQGKKRNEYWKAIALNQLVTIKDYAWKAKVELALEQINSKKKISFNANGSIEQDSYTKTDEYNDFVRYNSAIANILANAASDIAVVEQLKLKIKEAYKSGAKTLIVVAHSQGNEVLYSAIKALRSDRTFLNTDDEVKKFDGLVGYIQVAPPSPRLVTSTDNYFNYYPDHAQYIRHDGDMVIGSSFSMTGVEPIQANYVETVSSQFTTIFNGEGGLTKFFAVFGWTGGKALYHGMDDVYLSKTFKANRNQTGNSKFMIDHFKDNVREIAGKLEDNCDFPELEFTVSGSTKDPLINNMFNYTGYTSYNNKVSVTAKDKNDKDNSTVFTFRYEGKVVENLGTISDLSIPYSTAPQDEASVSSYYGGEVTATNKFGKSVSRNFSVRVPQDKPPVVTLISQQCFPDCGFGCDNKSVPYSAQLNIQDQDSGVVSGTNVTMTPPGVANYSFFNIGAQVEPISLIFKSSYLGVTAFTIPACSL